MRIVNPYMQDTIRLEEDTIERLDAHREEGQTREEFVEELLNIYESTRHIQEGYSE